MQNIETIMSNFGFELTEENKSEFIKAVNENYKTVNEVAKVKAERDKYKEQAETATETLKSFDGVDVEGYQAEIRKLTDELSKQETNYNNRVNAMEFDNFVDKAIRDSGTIDGTALKAHLDLDKLRESHNRNEDFKTMVEAIKSEKSYLFGTEPIKLGISSTQTKKGDSLTWKDIMSIKDTKERQEAIENHPDLIPN